MKRIGISELRANLQTFLKNVEQGDTIAVTCRGREIAHLVPPADRTVSARAALQKLRKTATVGDVISPTGEQWEVEE